MTYYYWMDSPIGRLLLVSDDIALRQIIFQNEKHPQKPASDWQEASSRPITEAVRQLESYFAGRLTEFSLPLAPKGTPFQLRVWRELQNIPYGDTISYGELAKRVGNPKASRAVGAANGSNPLPIVIPCHRVIGNNGNLVGYGGGIDIKKALLSLEHSQLK
jgi:methylated-DNA-[protein]-cysteine S-methyltransferase